MVCRRHLLCGFDPGHVGHRQIQQNYVRFEFLKLLDSILAILGLSANGPMARAYYCADNAPGGFGVIDNEYS